MKKNSKRIDSEFNTILIIAILVVVGSLSINYILNDSILEDQINIGEPVVDTNVRKDRENILNEKQDIKEIDIVKVENKVNRGIIFVNLIILFGAVNITFFRCIALSKLGPKLLTSRAIFHYDVLARYGWFYTGMVLILGLVVGRNDVLFIELLWMSLCWLLGLVAIWFIPNKLITSH